MERTSGMRLIRSSHHATSVLPIEVCHQQAGEEQHHEAPAARRIRGCGSPAGCPACQCAGSSVSSPSARSSRNLNVSQRDAQRHPEQQAGHQVTAASARSKPGLHRVRPCASPRRLRGRTSTRTCAAGLLSARPWAPASLRAWPRPWLRALASGFGFGLGLGFAFSRFHQVALVVLVGLEVGFVPAAALEAEHGRGHQLLQLALAAGRALSSGRVADLLQDLDLWPQARHWYS